MIFSQVIFSNPAKIELPSDKKFMFLDSEDKKFQIFLFSPLFFSSVDFLMFKMFHSLISFHLRKNCLISYDNGAKTISSRKQE